MLRHRDRHRSALWLVSTSRTDLACHPCICR